MYGPDTQIYVATIDHASSFFNPAKVAPKNSS
jgi:hypothetical protein